ncbi:MAG TPA: hypothetical protein VKB37_15200 [Jatrophihabitantaceae bacterium]|nr:hypothetical protein [Jatrophihabitantaceae bacterium]
MVRIITRPTLEPQAYAVRFHVRVPARASRDLFESLLAWSLDRMITQLETQGWSFVRLSERPPRGPLPVVPVKGFPKRPPGGNKHTPLDKHDDALARVSTLPPVTTFEAHLLTDEVDWEYSAIFSRPAIATEYVAPENGEAEPLWLRR